jgi:outer membrane protein assembly factor BamE
MPIQQGNFLEPRLVDKLEIGMTRAQVRYLLGTPMVPATFDADRWDYVYYLRKGHVHAPVHRRLTVFFRIGQGGARGEGRRERRARHRTADPGPGLPAALGRLGTPRRQARLAHTLAPFLARIARQCAVELDPIAVRWQVGARAQLTVNPDRRIIPGHIQPRRLRARRADRILNARARGKLDAPQILPLGRSHRRRGSA